MFLVIDTFVVYYTRIMLAGKAGHISFEFDPLGEEPQGVSDQFAREAAAGHGAPQPGEGKSALLLFFLLLLQHDLQDGLVGGDHALVAEGSHIANRVFRGRADNTVG